MDTSIVSETTPAKREVLPDAGPVCPVEDRSEMVTAVANASPDEWTELRSSCESCGLPFCVKRSSECASALCSDCEQSQETTSHSASDGESDSEFDPLSDLLTAATQERCKRQSRRTHACKGKGSKRRHINHGPLEAVEITPARAYLRNALGKPRLSKPDLSQHTSTHLLKKRKPRKRQTPAKVDPLESPC